MSTAPGASISAGLPPTALPRLSAGWAKVPCIGSGSRLPPSGPRQTATPASLPPPIASPLPCCTVGSTSVPSRTIKSKILACARWPRRLAIGSTRPTPTLPPSPATSTRVSPTGEAWKSVRRTCAAARRRRSRAPSWKRSFWPTPSSAAGLRPRRALRSPPSQASGRHHASSLVPCAERDAPRPTAGLRRRQRHRLRKGAPARMSRGPIWLGTDSTNPSLRCRAQQRRFAAAALLLAIILVAVERMALAEARHRPHLAALAILTGQEFAHLANRAFVGGGTPAAVFAVLGGVEILIALTKIRAHPSAPGALGRDERAVFGLRFRALGRDQVQALALEAVAVIAPVAVAVIAPVAVATIVVIALAMVPVTIIPVVVPVAPVPLTHFLNVSRRAPLDDVARFVGVGTRMRLSIVRLQIGLAAPARIGEPIAAIVLKAVPSQRAFDVGARVLALGLCGSWHRCQQRQQRKDARGGRRDKECCFHLTPYDVEVVQRARPRSTLSGLRNAPRREEAASCRLRGRGPDAPCRAVVRCCVLGKAGSTRSSAPSACAKCLARCRTPILPLGSSPCQGQVARLWAVVWKACSQSTESSAARALIGRRDQE